MTENKLYRLAIGFLVGVCFLPAALIGQMANLSGVVNTYLDITAVNIPSNSITLSSVATLAVGDTVFIIQMKGANMDASNSASFGDITSINSAGKFEFNIICDITGNIVTLERLLLANYDPAGDAQLIPVNIYANATVTSTVTAQAWDGSLGGVVVIAAPNGYVKLNSNIDVRGKGFRGGARQDMVSGCNCGNYATQYTSFFYPTADWHGALKAEGISTTVAGSEAGKGKQVNGGGGGNDHNSGGAGGGSYGAGGNGGNASASSCFFGSYCRGLNPGIGGLGLGPTYYNGVENRLFLGGGGGAGHYGNASVGGGSPGGDGERGAGIVIIWADSIDGNGFSIFADGNNILPTSAADGGGGGGGGGVIVLDARAFSSNTLDTRARGGNGANHSWGAGANNCKGTGGGGGGGVIWFRGPTNPPSIGTLVSGGFAGVQGGASCLTLGNAGSTNGANGTVLTNFTRPFGSATFPSCVLPIELAYFTAEKAGIDGVNVLWKTNLESNNFRFEIERAVDGQRFETIGRLASNSRNGEGATYKWLDKAPNLGTNWYRLRQVDFDGRSTRSEVVSVVYQGSQRIQIQALYPNPVKSPEDLILKMVSPKATICKISMTDVVGKTIYQIDLALVVGANRFRLPTQNFAKGIYFLRADADQLGTLVRKVKVD